MERKIIIKREEVLKQSGEGERGEEGEGGVLEYLHRAGNYYDSHTVSDVV